MQYHLATVLLQTSYNLAIVSGGLYSLLGAHIAHILLNWHEDKMNFYVRCRGNSLPMPVPKDEIFTNPRLRFIRLFVIVLWVLIDVAITWYVKWGVCNFDVQKSCKSDISYSCHFFGFITGLLLGMALIKTNSRKNKNVKKTLKIFSGFLFVTMLIFLVYWDHTSYLKEYEYILKYSNCNLTTFTKTCQAKCYCGMNNASLSQHPTFKPCGNFTICNDYKNDNWNKSKACMKLNQTLNF